MAKRKTANQQAFARQRKRIMAALRREEKKGYNVEPLRQALRAQFDNAPSRITKKTIQSLKNITPSSIRSLTSKVVQDYTPPTVAEEPYIEDYGLPSESTRTYETQSVEQKPIEHPDPTWSYGDEGNLYQNEQYARQLMNAIHDTRKSEPEEKVETDAVEYMQSGSEFILFDKNGEAIDKIYLKDGEYVSARDGDIYGTYNDLNKMLLSDMKPRENDWADLSDYAIDLIYSQTEALNHNTNGIFHQMFDAVRSRIGDSLFFQSLTSTNGYHSAFEHFQKMIHTGASYPQEFTRFGVAVINSLPVTQQERQALEEAFAQIIEAEYGAEIYE